MNREKNFIGELNRHSNAYKEVLCLYDTALHILRNEQMDRENTEDFSDELEAENRGIRTVSLSKIPGFLDIEVDGEKFRLMIDILDGLLDIGKHSPYVVMAICVSNDDLNHILQIGMFCLNLVPEERHEKIVEHLKNHRIDLIED